MNVLLLTTHLNTGGITSYLLTLTKGLIRSGVQVYIASSGGNALDAFEKAGAKHLVLNIRTKSELSPKIYFALRSLVEIVRKNDIKIVHSQTRITQVMGTVLKKMCNVAYVSTCHGYFKSNRLSRKLAPCWGDAVIAISEPVRMHLEKDFLVSPIRIKLIYNGIDVEDFPLVSKEIKRQKREKYDTCHQPVIGIIARLSDVKGHKILIKAMKKIVSKMPDARLMIVGEGKMEAELKRQVVELKLEEHINFYPFEGATREFLPLFDVFVMPSLQEGLGLAVMEAQAAGVPVVASRVGGLPNLIENKKTGILVESNNSEALADAVVDLLNDLPKSEAMGLRAREFIKERFSAEVMTGQTLALYNNLLAQ